MSAPLAVIKIWATNKNVKIKFMASLSKERD